MKKKNTAKFHKFGEHRQRHDNRMGRLSIKECGCGGFWFDKHVPSCPMVLIPTPETEARTE